MSCIACKNCKKASVPLPECYSGDIVFPDTGVNATPIFLIIEKPNGTFRELELTTEAGGTLKFNPSTDLSAADEDWLNSFAGLIQFAILDKLTRQPLTLTDVNAVTADCVLIQFDNYESAVVTDIVLELVA